MALPTQKTVDILFISIMNPEPALLSAAPWSSRWIVVDDLSGGGQGDTFIVQEQATGREGVLKRLRSEKARELKARARMHQEVSALQTLEPLGANVPKYFDGNTAAFEQLDIPLYFVMERIPGSTLDKVILRTRLSLEDSITVCIDLCRSLKIAFSADLCHRDIKPQNLILRNNSCSNVVMLDFGLSFNKKADHRVTDTAETIDNSFCSMPERRGVHEDKRDFRSDITSVIAVLFYCLTGQNPRNLRSSGGHTPNRCGEIKFPTITDPALLAQVHRILDRGLENDIQRRFQTITEAEDRLKALQTAKTLPSAEDFEFEARGVATEIIDIDMRSRHAMYRSKLSSLDGALGKLITKIPQYPPFKYQAVPVVSFAGMPIVFENTPQSLEDSEFWRFEVGVRLAGHEAFFAAVFVAVENYPECCIRLRIEYRDFTANRPCELKTERELFRFMPENPPTAEEFKPFLESTLLDTMRLFKEHLSQRPETAQ